MKELVAKRSTGERFLRNAFTRRLSPTHDYHYPIGGVVSRLSAHAETGDVERHTRDLELCQLLAEVVMNGHRPRLAQYHVERERSPARREAVNRDVTVVPRLDDCGQGVQSRRHCRR